MAFFGESDPAILAWIDRSLMHIEEDDDEIFELYINDFHELKARIRRGEPLNTP